MALTTPDDVNEVIDRAINDVFLAMEPFGARPSLKSSWLKALIVAFCNRVYDFYYGLDRAALEAMPDTAIVNLERWAAFWGITRVAGSSSSGNAIATGSLGGTIPAETTLTVGDGTEYRVAATVSVSAKSLSVASITRSGSTATLTTSAKHELGSTVKVTVTGADQPEYNVVNATTTITGNKTLTYEVAGTPATPATGTILLGFDSATMIVEAVETGSDGDLPFDSVMAFDSPIVGVSDVAVVDYDGVGGGSDRETGSALRERFLYRVQNPVAHFNVPEITAAAKTVSGVTRVFVQEITPAVGKVTVYFMRDGESPAIPGGAEVAAVDAVTQAIRPANTDEDDVIVAAPTAVPVDFTFTDIQPATDSMKSAVEANLEQFFAERTTLGVNVDSDAYRSAIFNTVDPTNGDEITTFTLSAPTGDISVGSGEIATLGNVAF